VVHPDDRERAAATWNVSLATGTEYDVEYRVRARAGGWRHIRARGVPIPDADGAVREWVGTMEDVTPERAAEDAQRFLAEAGEVLASSLDSEHTLAALARLVVPRLADFCSVYVAEPDGRLRHLVVAHADPARGEWARELGRKYPPDPDAPYGIPAVVRSGEPEFIPELTDEMVAGAAHDPEHLALLRGLGLRSVMIVPRPPAGGPWGRSRSSPPSPAGGTPGPTSTWPSTWAGGPGWRWTTPACSRRARRPCDCSVYWSRRPGG
jgi:hypothetical protein